MILINLVAWGYVGYKIYGALQGDDDITVNYDSAAIKKITAINEPESETLNLNYADPFLKSGNYATAKAYASDQAYKGTKKPEVEKTNAKSTQSVTVPSLEIKYLGLIKNSDKGKSIAMLYINGKSFFAKENEVVEGYLVKQITESTIVFSKGKEKITISK